MTRRLPVLLALLPLSLAAQSPAGFRLTDVTAQAGIKFTHNTGAFGKKYLPETMGSGNAFFDYDNDGWQDIILINSTNFGKRPGPRSVLKLYRNNRNGTFSDVTRAAGLDLELYGMGAAAADFDNDGWVDLYLSCVGQSRLFKNTGKGTFSDVTLKAGLGKRENFSTSAIWFDYDRDGHLDLFVSNYVRWTEATDIWCSFDGKTKAYCTPEAYRGTTSWLFRNNGDGTFEDVTAKSGIFDSSSKSLGVAMLDVDNDGWMDLLVANDTQPNKLYRNNHNGTFSEIAVRAGLAFSEDGKARAGMGVDAADFDNSGFTGVVVTNFDNEMLGLYRGTKQGVFVDQSPRSSLGRQTRRSLGFGCFFFDANLNGMLDLLVVNGHIDETITRARQDVFYAQPPHLFLNEGKAGFRDVVQELGEGFASRKVARGASYADYDNDGDLDVLISTNNGPAFLYRNDMTSGNKGVRVKLVGTRSNRDAIGAVLKFELGELHGSRLVKTGSSYLSQSELPVTIGAGKAARIDRLTVLWPSGKQEEYRDLPVGKLYRIVENQGIQK